MKNEKKVQKEFEEEMARRQTLTDQISVSVYNNHEEIPSNNINGQTETELPISA